MRSFLASLLRLYAVNIVNGVLGVLLVPYAVHRLGVAGYGLYAIYTVLAGYVVFVEVGLGRGLQRELASEQHPAVRARLLRAASGLYLVVCAGLLVATPIVCWLVPRFVFPVPDAQRLALQAVTVLVALEYVVGVPASMMHNQCIAAQRFDRYSTFALASGLLRYGVLFVVLSVTARVEIVVAAMVVRRAVDVVLARAIMGGLPTGAWRPSFDRAVFGTLLRRSSGMSVGQLLQLSIVAAGSVLVNATLGIAALGRFRAAFDLASKVWFFSNSIGFILFPKFVQMMSGPAQRRELARVVPRALFLSWALYSGIAIVGGAAAPWVLDWLRLDAAVSPSLFLLLLAGVSFNAHAGVGYEFVQAAGGAGRAATLAGVSLAILVGSFLLIAVDAPQLAIGWAWLISQGSCALLWDAIVLRYLDLPLRTVTGELAIRIVALASVVAFVLGGVGLVPTVVWWLAALLALPPLASALYRARGLMLQPAVS